MGFAQDIRNWNEKALKAASDNTNKIVQELFDLPVNYSPSPTRPGPYATGLLVNQWYPSIGTPDLSVTNVTNDYGADSFARISAMVSTNPFNGKDNVVYLTNSTEEAIYADRLGWVRGKGTNGWVWSGKPAYFMRDKALLNIQAKYS